MTKFGVSLSTKYCNELGVSYEDVLEASLKDFDFNQYRLMSYWDICEPEQGKYNFDYLDRQFSLLEQSDKKISLCVGMRQPRWPETHLPTWAKNLAKKDYDAFQSALLEFNGAVVLRYKSSPALTSYQLENEALNRGIGKNLDYNRDRLIREFAHIKSLDASRPIIMTTSNNVGIPFRAPFPDMVGFSLYLSQHSKRGYIPNRVPVEWFTARKKMLNLAGREVFIHELQAEPWGPKATHKLSLEEQERSMNLDILFKNLRRAKRIKVEQIDLWGLEWWYWRMKKFNDRELWSGVQQLLTDMKD